MSLDRHLAMAAAFGVAMATLAATAQATTPDARAIPTMRQDQDARSPDIDWPPGSDQAMADLFAHNALLIHASCAKVFSRIVGATNWPSWYANAWDVRILGGGSTL